MKLAGKKIAMLVGPGFEDLEFWVPFMRMQEEGAEVTVVGIRRRVTYSSKSGGLSAMSDAAAEDVNAADYDAVLIPGGWAPDRLRRYDAVRKLVREAHEQGKIIGSICHAGQVLISAGVVKGHRATGTRAIKDDLENAGATWVDESAFRDGNIVWGRVVADIPHYCRELVTALAEK